VVEFWSTQGGRGTHESISRKTRTPCTEGVSWGEIRIVDRLGVANRYVCFGGRCDADRIGDAVIVAVTSSAPILRRGGHSQGWDDGADAVGAFFGRLLVTVDYVPGFEQRLAAATPLSRYAAFIADADTRDRDLPMTALDARPFAATVRTEARRVRRDHPDDWEVGLELLSDIGRT